jgi:uncharacterized damage-inducible protein DinB
MFRFARQRMAVVSGLLGLSLAPHAGAQATAAPAASANPLTAALTDLHRTGQNFILTAANAMPEDKYGFRPVPEAQSFAEILGHIVDWGYTFCSGAQGEASPHAPTAEKTLTTKAELLPAVHDAFAYCDGVFAGMTDTRLAEPVTYNAGHAQRTGIRLTPLTLSITHLNEHFGNFLTYLRMNGMGWPPTPPAASH